MTICPCCKRPMESGPIPVKDLLDARLSGQFQLIVLALVKAYPRPLALPQLVNAVYGHMAGPEDPQQVLRAVICRLRPKLKPFGWTIPANRGSRGLYSLEPIKEP